MAQTKTSLRKINDKLFQLAYEGIDVPDDELDNDALSESSETEQEIAFVAEMEALKMERDEKIEQTGYVILDLYALSETYAQEIKRLQKIKRVTDNHGLWLKFYLLGEMVRAGIKSFKEGFIGITVRKSNMSAQVAKDEFGKPDHTKVDQRFVTPVVTYKIDTQGAIREHKADKEPIKGFAFIDDKQHLIIK